MSGGQNEGVPNLEADFLKPLHAQLADDIPGAERVTGATVSYGGEDHRHLAADDQRWFERLSSLVENRLNALPAKKLLNFFQKTDRAHLMAKGGTYER